MPEEPDRETVYYLKPYRWTRVVFLAILLLFLLFSCRRGGPVPSEDNPSRSGSTSPFVVVDHETLSVEISSTTKDRTMGLMFRDSLPERSGMFFIFEFEARHTFWMKNTTIPLSIAFINSNYIIVDIQDMEPLSLKECSPRFPCLFALEVNRHWFKKHGINVGDSVQVHF